MAHPLAEFHRRIAAAEHGVEENLKQIASRIRPGKRVAEDAEKISQRADEHLDAADRIDRRTEEN